jgi:predicted Zn-dependent protease
VENPISNIMTRPINSILIKLEDAPHPPEFLSTHPSPENRIEKINEVWQSLGGKEGNLYVDSYMQFKESLP